MSASCDIEFENSHCSKIKVIYSGQLMKGTAVVKLIEPVTIRGIYLRLLGEACYKFKLREKIENHLDEKITCFDGTAEKTCLNGGTYHYPFECELKDSLPTSLEEHFDTFNASIRYKVRIHFDESFDEPPIYEEPFTVVNPLDLKLLPSLQKPFIGKFKKKFRYFCGRPFPDFLNNKVKLIGRLPWQVYVPGESIELLLDVLNESGEDIKTINVKLVREVSLCTSTNDCHGERTTAFYYDSVQLYQGQFEGCESKRKYIKTYRISIAVPSTPPSDQNSKIINVSYEILITAAINLCYYDLQMEIPITIAAYPLTKRSTASFSSYDLPIYEEAVYTKDNMNDGFKPKYPVSRHAIVS